MRPETIGYLDRKNACDKYAHRTGKNTLLVGYENARGHSELLKIVDLDNFFPAEGLLIFYAAFPETKEQGTQE